jgi:uncharacterized lipoprotein YddW (UPF0748 family)
MKAFKLFLAVLILCTTLSCKKSSSSSPPPPTGGGGGGGNNPPPVDPSIIRGAWVTTTASTALNSAADIKTTVANFKAAGLSHIFIVVYNNARTVYPSTVMQNLIGKSIKEGFEGRDPLKEMIDEAHANNMKVHAWFEYGFSSSYSANGGLIVQAKPHWAGKNQAGNLLVKNGFDWLNALHPEVQDFLMSLIMEVVTRYNVDGIQGDDRLPAMPSEGGYDDYTVNLYQAEHAGANPPTNTKDPAWLQWRAQKLNKFMKRIFTEVKAAKPAVKIIMSPSVYPFALNEYLQDWPTWVDSSWVDGIIPQVYRYDIAAYRATLQSQKTYFKSRTNLYTPGVLLKSGTYLPSDQFLTDMIQANRTEGYKGEVFFFYEGVKDKLNYFINQYPQIK